MWIVHARVAIVPNKQRNTCQCCNAPINVMPHYPPPGQCWGIGGDLNFAKLKSLGSNAPPIGHASRSNPNLRLTQLIIEAGKKWGI